MAGSSMSTHATQTDGEPAEVDLDALRRRVEAELGEFPRIGLFVFEAPTPSRLQAVLDRIPKPGFACLAEIVVMEDRTESGLDAAPASSPGQPPIRIHRAPRELGFGGVRKAAFEHALLKNLDAVVFLRAGIHEPEILPRLLAPLLEGRDEAIWAARRLERLGGGLPLARVLAHRLTTGLLNRLLGLRLSDYHSSFRAFPMRAIQELPFQLNADDRSFDLQLAIQCRILGLPIREVPVPPSWKEFRSDRAGLAGVLAGVGSAVDYRLHQIHWSRRHRYLVDRGVHYTLKQSPTSSHMQIVERIQPGSEVLDLGCSQGLLARPLKQKGVRVTGVDAGPGEDLADELGEYHQRDLELPLELPTGRVYDYVVSSDVIEHLRNRTQLLRSARRYLKPGGRLLISTPNIAVWVYRLSLLVGRFEYGPKGTLDETHVHLFTRATFRRAVERAGFQVVNEMPTALPFEVVFESTGRSRLIGALARLYHAFARLWPELFAYQFILEAEIITLDEEATSEWPGAGTRA